MLPAGHIYKLGKPGGILLSAGIEDLPIELNAERLAMKASEAYRSGHPFGLEAVKNLPEAINRPIAVFDSSTRPDAKIILTTLKYGGHNFVVALEARNSVTNRKIEADINHIMSVYPKDEAQGILHWIINGKMRYNNKMRVFFAEQWANSIDGKNTLEVSLKPEIQQRINLAEVNAILLNDAANVVNNFNNPDIPEIKNDPQWSDEDWERARKFL